jgi:hypothetical protein
MIPPVEPLPYTREQILNARSPTDDVQARQWATEHPDDPRAAAILQRLGGR